MNFYNSETNLINKKNALESNYDLSAKEIYLTIYFRKDSAMFVVANLDNNYACGIFASNADDEKTNSEIIDSIFNDKWESVSSSRNVMHKIMGKEIAEWFCYKVQKSESSPKDIARSIRRIFHKLKAKSEFYGLGSIFVNVLKTWLDNDVGNHKEEIDELSFLKLSDNEDIRKLYLVCLQRCDNKYNNDMTWGHL